MSKTPIFLQNGSSTLYDLSLQNVMARLAKKNIFVLLMFHTSILSLQKASKKQIRCSYRMSWPIKSLQNEHFKTYNLAFWGLLLQNASVMGPLVTTKWLNINHL